MPNRSNSEYDSNLPGGDYEGVGYGSRLLNAREIPSDIRRSTYQTGTHNGKHAGKGPKGYIRSDSIILEEVSEILMMDAEVDASDIEVQVQSGVVTLTGTVPDRQMKHMAEHLVEGCTGVKDIENHIRVQRDSSQGSQNQQNRQ